MRYAKPSSSLFHMKDNLIAKIEKDIEILKESPLGITPWQVILAIGATLAGVVSVTKDTSLLLPIPAIIAFAVVTLLMQLFHIGFFSKMEERIRAKSGRALKYTTDLNYQIPYILFKVAPLAVPILLFPYLHISYSGILIIGFCLPISLIPWLFMLHRYVASQFSTDYRPVVTFNRGLWTVMTFLPLFAAIPLLVGELIAGRFSQSYNGLIIGGLAAILWFLIDALYHSLTEPPRIKRLIALRDDLIFERIEVDEGLTAFRQIKEGLFADECLTEELQKHLDYLAQVDENVTDFTLEIQGRGWLLPSEKEEFNQRVIKACDNYSMRVSENLHKFSDTHLKAALSLKTETKDSSAKMTLIEATRQTNKAIEHLKNRIGRV